MIAQLNVEQARRLSKLKHDPDQSLNHVYESIRSHALLGHFEFPYMAAAKNFSKFQSVNAVRAE